MYLQIDYYLKIITVMLMYNSDYKKAGGFNNSEYMHERGELWDFNS